MHNPRRLMGIGLISFFFLMVFVVDVQYVRAAEDAPIKNAKGMVFDDTRSLMFVVNEDSTFSVYDFLKKDFVISRRELSGLEFQNPSKIFISPRGSFLAILSGSNFYWQISVFKTADVLSNKFIPTSNYTFELKPKGSPRITFSSDDKIILLSYGDTFAFLSPNTSKKEELIIDGVLGHMTAIGLGQAAVINESKDAVIIINVDQHKIISTIKVGSVPREIIYNEFTKKLYVSHTGSDDVYVIDPFNGKIVAILAVGADPTSIVYNKENGDVFVANNSMGTLNVIDVNNAIKTVDLKSPAYFESSPLFLSFLNKSKKLLIVNATLGKFFLYDPIHLNMVNSGDTPVYAVNVFASETLGDFFIHNINADSISMIDAAGDMTRIPDISLVEQPYLSRPQSIYIADELNKIFVTNLGNNIVTVIDADTLKPIAKIPVNRSPQGAIFVRATKKLYVFSPSDSSIAVIDTAKPGYPVKIIQGFNHPMGITANQKTNRIYVTNTGNSTIAVIDGNMDSIIGTVELPKGSFPLILNTNEDLNKVYVNLYGNSAVAVIDGKSTVLETQIPVGENPMWNLYVPSWQRLFVTIEEGRKVVIIDPRTNSITQTFTFSGRPYRIFHDTRSDDIYINFRKEQNVAIIRRKKNSSDGEIFKEVVMPFWGETDTLYNMAIQHREKNLAYFALGIKNQIIVIKDDLDNERVKKSIYYATIFANGDVAFAPGAIKKSAEKGSIFSQIYQYIIGVGLILLFIIFYLVRKRK